MTWHLVFEDSGKEVGRLPMGGCLSALRGGFASDLTSRMTKEYPSAVAYAVYHKPSCNNNMIDYLMSDSSVLPIKHNVNFEVRGNVVRIPLTTQNYRHAMFTKFILVNLYVTSFSTNDPRRKAHRYLTDNHGLPSALSVLVLCTLYPLFSSYRSMVNPVSSDSWIHPSNPVAFAAALVSPNAGLAKELAVGAVSLHDCMRRGLYWKDAPWSLNRMFSEHVAGMERCGTNSIDDSIRTQTGFYAYYSKMMEFIADCYKRRTTKPSAVWRDVVLPKFPNQVMFK